MVLCYGSLRALIHNLFFYWHLSYHGICIFKRNFNLKSKGRLFKNDRTWLYAHFSSTNSNLPTMRIPLWKKDIIIKINSYSFWILLLWYICFPNHPWMKRKKEQELMYTEHALCVPHTLGANTHCLIQTSQHLCKL